MPMRLEGSCRCGAISFSVCLKSAGGGGYAINIMLLRDKASWVEPQIGPNDDCFEGYPKLSIEDWHKKHGLWIA